MPDRNDPLADSDEYARYELEEGLRKQLRDAYNEDLRRILALPEGQRVLFHWLDASGLFGLISSSGEETIKAAAVSDFGKQRLFEINRADPEGFIKIMRVGAGVPPVYRDASSGSLCAPGQDRRVQPHRPKRRLPRLTANRRHSRQSTAHVMST